MARPPRLTDTERRERAKARAAARAGAKHAEMLAGVAAERAAGARAYRAGQQPDSQKRGSAWERGWYDAEPPAEKLAREQRIARGQERVRLGRELRAEAERLGLDKKK